MDEVAVGGINVISNIAFSPDGQIILISYGTNFVGFALNDDVTKTLGAFSL
jgi:hypothetical protein